ncbi:hypothetical protein Hanom_Chr16g01486741 [Helianthus anomalus]
MVLAQIGNIRLIASNIASSSNEVISSTYTREIQNNQNDPLYEKIVDLIKAQKEKEITKPPTYATTVQDNDEEDSWFITERKKKIIILNQEDIKLLDDPWVLMQKYLDPASYDATSYKTHQYYENILQLMETAEVRHVYPSDREKHMYNFSQIFIKGTISPQKWGLSTLKEREFLYPETNNRQTYKYNYWDYIRGFKKYLFYENSKKKHSWNKMIQTKESTKLIEAQGTVNLINTKIEQHKLHIAKKQQRQLPSPWEQISRRLIMEKQDVSKEEIIKSYMEEMKR